MIHRTKLAALYVRVSTTDKQHPANQVEPLEAWCKAAGYTVAAVYTDAESGGSATRPQFVQMMKDAAARKFGIVVFWSLDRFTREGIGPTFEYLRRLRAAGCMFYSYTEEYFRADGGPADELLCAVVAWVAGFERRRRVERVKAGLDRARAAGVVLGRKPREFPDNEIQSMVKSHIEGRTSYAYLARIYNTSKATIHRTIAAELRKANAAKKIQPPA